MDLIKIKDVKKTYKTGTTAIYDLDLTIKNKNKPHPVRGGVGVRTEF